MKKIYALLALLFMVVSCYGQEKSLNLSGIPPWVQYKDTLHGETMWRSTQKQNKSMRQNSPFGKVERSRIELNYFTAVDPRLGSAPEARDKYTDFFAPVPNDFLPGNLQFLRLRPRI